MLDSADYSRFEQYCRNTLTIAGKKDPNITYYKSLPICLLDAVFSIGVRYSSVEKTIKRYIAYYQLFIPQMSLNSNEKIIPNNTPEHTINDFLNNIDRCSSINYFAEKILNNKQRTSSRNGILKAQACYDIAQLMKKHNINTYNDFSQHSADTVLADEIKSIKGQKSGIMLNYLYMLTGNDSLIKPDRHVVRFVQNVFPTMTELKEIQDLLKGTANLLKLSYPDMTPRLLDWIIWDYQKL